METLLKSESPGTDPNFFTKEMTQKVNHPEPTPISWTRIIIFK